MIGGVIPAPVSPTPAPPSPVIEARGLGLERGGRRVLSDIDACVWPGDAIGILGRNGAGKSTLLETLLGFHAPGAGEVLVWGRPASLLDGDRKRRIGFVPQRDELLDGLTVERQVALVSSFYPRWDPALVDRLLGEWQLPRGQAIRRLSLGQRQRLSIVLALATRPALLVLDEPVASLDPLVRRQFLAELGAFAADGRTALLFSSHIVSDLQGLVNRAWIIEEGRVRWQGSMREAGGLLGAPPDAPVDLEALFRRVLA